MERPSKIEALYMHCARVQFAAGKRMQEDMRVWTRALASGNIPRAIPLTESERVATDFLKHIWEPGLAYSVPARLFDVEILAEELLTPDT
eukprot:9165437-Lingulodinium_polyedra.AAC.1